MTMMNPRRPHQHAVSARRQKSADTHVFRWIRHIQSQGREPAIILLQEFSIGTSLDEVCDTEIFHIKCAKEHGHQLTNGNAGGKGSFNPSQLTRDRRSAKLKGCKRSAETRAKMSAARKLRPPENAELRAAKSERAKRQHIEHPTPRSTNEKRNTALRGNQYAVGGKSYTGKTHTLDARLKMQQAWTPERRAAQALRNKEMSQWSLEERIRRSETSIAIDKRRLVKARALRIV